MTERHKIYFASDFHLGSFPREKSKLRERNIINWLDYIKRDASELFLVGDVFDFWFEYATVVPKGYIRFLGKLAELADMGIKITFFKGNHDMWMFGYLREELHAQIVDNEIELNLDDHTFFIHHGDGLGHGDTKYKILKKFFRSSLCQWLFARIHPNLGIGIAQRWSKHSRGASNNEEKFMGAEKEWLIQFAHDKLKEKHIDYFIFGHRHLSYDFSLQDNSRIINLGEWFSNAQYAVWDGQTLELKTWNS